MFSTAIEHLSFLFLKCWIMYFIFSRLLSVIILLRPDHSGLKISWNKMIFFYISESYDFYVKSSKKCFGGIDFYLFHIYFWSGLFSYFFDLLYAAALATKTNFGLHKNKYFPKRTTKLSNDIVLEGILYFFIDLLRSIFFFFYFEWKKNHFFFLLAGQTFWSS